VTDLIVKAKQIEYLINSLPEPEPEEEQVRWDIVRSESIRTNVLGFFFFTQARRLKELEDEMQIANAQYIRAVNRASTWKPSVSHSRYWRTAIEDLHAQISEVLNMMLIETDGGLVEPKLEPE